jgi:hypothetical protein
MGRGKFKRPLNTSSDSSNSGNSPFSQSVFADDESEERVNQQKFLSTTDGKTSTTADKHPLTTISESSNSGKSPFNNSVFADSKSEERENRHKFLSTTDENPSAIADDNGDEGAESSDRNNGVEMRINQSMKFRRSRSEDNRSSQVPMGFVTKEMFTRYPPSKQHFQTNPTQQRSKIVSKQNQHQAKKKFKLSNNADVNDENVICSEFLIMQRVIRFLSQKLCHVNILIKF